MGTQIKKLAVIRAYLILKVAIFCYGIGFYYGAAICINWARRRLDKLTGE